ncbi:hypothetical protein L2E82_38664 [Cichorium intybus]|uniref:Uncharacterized protein n=1 Tax=Cichorium intybus TaxID=13427 RepID=A0ACB9AH14_CICIN|nr:hypothetical protein L2E82_38664 [Cichorium intybus]
MKDMQIFHPPRHRPQLKKPKWIIILVSLWDKFFQGHEANALKDPDNQHFVLLSDSCVPLRGFDYVYNYLLYTNVSFIDSFEDPGPHGSGRYSNHMLPEVEKKFFRKGAQPGMDGRNCYADEHYLPTFFNSISESVHVTSDEKKNLAEEYDNYALHVE